MARAGPMEEREVWIQAGAILAAHGELTTDYIIDQMSDALGDRIAVEDWRRVAAAVDAISNAAPQ
jgi:hypothetical protein